MIVVNPEGAGGTGLPVHLVPQHRASTVPVSESWWVAEVALGLGVATATELWLAVRLLGNAPNALQIGALHLGVLALLMAWRWSWRARHRTVHLGDMFILCSAVLGPIGAFGTLWTAAVHRLFRNGSGSFERWWKKLTPRRHKVPEALFTDLVSGRERPISALVFPFTDMIQSGCTEDKHALIMSIARDYQPSLAPALKLAMRDPLLRSQAAIAISRIESVFSDKAMRLARAAEACPSDFNANLALARHLDDYAFLGLWDAERTGEIRVRALAFYHRCLALRPDDAVSAAIGRMLCRSGRVAEAAEILRPVVYGRNRALETLSWYGECLYRLGRFEELHHLMEVAKYLGGFRETLPRPVQRVAEFWGQGVPSENRAVLS